MQSQIPPSKGHWAKLCTYATMTSSNYYNFELLQYSTLCISIYKVLFIWDSLNYISSIWSLGISLLNIKQYENKRHNTWCEREYQIFHYLTTLLTTFSHQRLKSPMKFVHFNTIFSLIYRCHFACPLKMCETVQFGLS